MTTIPSVTLAEAELEPAGDWHPARWTRSLSGTEDFTTEGDKLIAFAERHWRSPEVEQFLADPWQVWLLRHVLETYPPDWPVVHLRGELRYRQVVISVARQNGKSVLGALLCLYFVAMHVRGPRVVGLASVESQAKIVYDRVKYVIDNNPAIRRELRATVTAGIHRRDGTGQYQTLPSKEETAQGEPISGCLYDELHLGLSALWDAIVLGQSARRNSLLVGITTAGDADSDLLRRLYAEGEVALAGGDERFGFFVWEADSDELTEANIIAANPAVACGRKPLDEAMRDARKLWRAPKDKDGVTGRDRCIRYVLNRFVEGSSTAALSLVGWRDTETEAMPDGTGEPVYGIAVTDSWAHGAVLAARRAAGGGWRAELVAGLVSPTFEQLEAIALALTQLGPSAVAVERETLNSLAIALRERGIEVWSLTAGEMRAAASTSASLIGGRRVAHPDDDLVRHQLARAKRRDLPEGWRLSRGLSTSDIDAVLGLVQALHVATVRPDVGIPIF